MVPEDDEHHPCRGSPPLTYYQEISTLWRGSQAARSPVVHIARRARRAYALFKVSLAMVANCINEVPS